MQFPSIQGTFSDTAKVVSTLPLSTRRHYKNPSILSFYVAYYF